MGEEKKIILERMAMKFIQIQNLDLKGYAVMVMTAYESGKANGIMEERQRREDDKN